MESGNGHTGTYRYAGYAALVERFGLEVIPSRHVSLVGGGARRVETQGGVTREIYPAAYWPGETLAHHLEFALKYDGVNLAILEGLFRQADRGELTEYVRGKPNSKYARRLWFLYEFLTGERLPLEDLRQGSYVDLLEPERYYTAGGTRRERRQRVNNNLLGDRRFCPIVRRTDCLRSWEERDLPGRCRALVARYPAAVLSRAFSYMYNRETKSSFAIENLSPDASRLERFMALLHLAEREDFCTKEKLVELQNLTVDPRFRDTDYRGDQNYVGETIAWGEERIHYVSPKPEDLPGLMDGLLASHGIMQRGGVHAVVHAAVVAYGFVFLHPFEDGNGRIHRVLIHNILARRGYTPEGVLFPVSAAMLNDRPAYDASLEAFSKPLVPLVDAVLDEEGRMTVRNETALWYRSIDMTAQVEALFRFIDTTIDTELAVELEFLARYDAATGAMKEVVDMPDRLVDLFIRFCLQNNGRLSPKKRRRHFPMLTDDEVAALEECVRAQYEELRG